MAEARQRCLALRQRQRLRRLRICPRSSRQRLQSCRQSLTRHTRTFGRRWRGLHRPLAQTLRRRRSTRSRSYVRRTRTWSFRPHCSTTRCRHRRIRWDRRRPCMRGIRIRHRRSPPAWLARLRTSAASWGRTTRNLPCTPCHRRRRNRRSTPRKWSQPSRLRPQRALKYTNQGVLAWAPRLPSPRSWRTEARRRACGRARVARLQADHSPRGLRRHMGGQRSWRSIGWSGSASALRSGARNHRRRLREIRNCPRCLRDWQAFWPPRGTRRLSLKPAVAACRSRPARCGAEGANACTSAGGRRRVFELPSARRRAAVARAVGRRCGSASTGAR